jgi:hypothetical protein
MGRFSLAFSRFLSFFLVSHRILKGIKRDRQRRATSEIKTGCSGKRNLLDQASKAT